jgi:outer membrane protein
MAQAALPGPSTCTAAVPRMFGWLPVLMPLLLVAGCASWRRFLPIPLEVTQAGVAARVLIPPDLNVNPAETVVKPGEPSRPPAEPSLPAAGASAVGLMGSPMGQGPFLAAAALAAGGAGSAGGQPEPTTFGLADAIAFALQNNPRLRSARAAIERARGQEQAAFAPFLPQIDLLGQYGVVSSTLAPGVPGNEGFILANGTGTRSYAETEVGLEWTLYDFGRTGGRYRQAGARERVADLQLVRAEQTVQFDVAAAYLDVLLARASRRVQEDAVRRAEAILEDTEARRKAGVLLKEDVLRAQVQLSESREALIAAREREFNAVARLNNVMGRNAALPLEVVDLDLQPPLPGTLPGLLERAAAQRPEVGLAQQEVAAAQAGREAARGDFLPRVFVRAVAGRTDGQSVVTGWQEGAGLHLEAPLYSGGLHRGELHAAEADVEDAVANAQSILDAISLQVNLAYRGAVAAQETIELARTAVEQAEENLRLVRVRYRNGNATPTDIVDAEAAATRSQQRFVSAGYSYLAALARLDYAVGGLPGVSGPACETTQPERPHSPRKLPEEK